LVRWDLLDRQDQRVSRVLLEELDLEVQLEVLDHKVPQESLVLLDQLVHQDLREHQVPKGIQELLEVQDRRDRPEIQEIWGHQDHQEPWVLPALLEFQASQAPLVHLVLQVCRARLGLADR